jgi:hypothetical protein
MFVILIYNLLKTNIMKKIKFLGAFAFLLFLTACSSNDDGASTSGNIVGKWNFSKFIINGTTELYLHECAAQKDHTEFFANNTGTDTYYNNCDDSYTDTYLYQKEGNTLTMAHEDEYPITLEILELTSSTLRVKHFFDENEDGVDDEIITVLTKN